MRWHPAFGGSSWRFLDTNDKDSANASTAYDLAWSSSVSFKNLGRSKATLDRPTIRNRGASENIGVQVVGDSPQGIADVGLVAPTNAGDGQCSDLGKGGCDRVAQDIIYLERVGGGAARLRWSPCH